MKKNTTTLDAAVDVGLRDRELFDWKDVHGAFKKLQEEVGELEEVLSQNDSPKTYEEFSDVFFTLLQVARHLDINPEENLKFALEKYNLRYSKMCDLILKDSRDIKNLKLAELEEYWAVSKKDTHDTLNKILSGYLCK